ncbi:MAG: prephenate dehydrogenase/arogenate dehydrogenase family protein [Phycisphaerales bacterium]|nr:prephenate dehydrogenase/arogenate dehydrogenase family protein [Phycisphaerales bacterium]
MQKSRTTSFGAVAIIGVGLLGASLGLALKNRRLASRVVGVGRRGSASLKTALKIGAIDTASTDMAAVSECDLIVLASNIGAFPDLMRQLARCMKPGAIVTDVGSTKEQVMQWAAELLPAGVFVGSHPMAGSERRGPEFARADLYQDAVCLVCAPRQGLNAKTLRRVESLWRAVGMRTLSVAARQHDEIVATISHVPHAVAAALVQLSCSVPGAEAAIAGGFVDTTRIASGDPTMWTDIFRTNGSAIDASLGVLIAMLEHYRRVVRRGAPEELQELFAEAKKRRDALVAKLRPKKGAKK